MGEILNTEAITLFFNFITKSPMGLPTRTLLVLMPLYFARSNQIEGNWGDGSGSFSF